jgi:hypothetical protein
VANITLKDGAGSNLSVGSYVDANGNLALGHVPLVGGLPVATGNALPVGGVSLGAPADAEAAADGSIIGLLKRLRTLLARPLLTEALTATPIVAAATGAVVIAANANRKTLCLINPGAGDAFFGFASTVNAATGWPLYAGGGGFTWALGEAPTGAVYVFSTVGTTIIAKEGV